VPVRGHRHSGGVGSGTNRAGGSRSKIVVQRIGIADLVELSRKTGLIVRLVDSAGLSGLFVELENYDPQERAETFEYLKHALNETRRSVGAEAIYPNE
jgi:hypothetical protein